MRLGVNFLKSQTLDSGAIEFCSVLLERSADIPRTRGATLVYPIRALWSNAQANKVRASPYTTLSRIVPEE